MEERAGIERMTGSFLFGKEKKSCCTCELDLNWCCSIRDKSFTIKTMH